jgi:hypothetical protein
MVIYIVILEKKQRFEVIRGVHGILQCVLYTPHASNPPSVAVRPSVRRRVVGSRRMDFQRLFNFMKLKRNSVDQQLLNFSSLISIGR